MNRGYSLVLSTANRSDVGPMKEFLQCTEADIVFGQETHIVASNFTRFVDWGRKEGWKVLGTAAQPIVGKGSTGGVFVAARARIGMGYSPGLTIAELVPGRLTVVHLATLAKGGMVAYSVYLWPSEGLTERNLAVLHVLASHVLSHGKVWVAGGDWNLEPDVLCGARWPEKMGQ